jgi:outer membrane protein
VQSDQDAYEGTQYEARVGSRTILDILNANQELLQSRIASASAVCAADVSTYQVVSAMGQLTPRSLHLPVKPYDPTVHYGEDAYSWVGFGD